MALIETIRGPIEESLMERRVGNEPDLSWQEYWYEGEMVKRDARMVIRPLEASDSELAS